MKPLVICKSCGFIMIKAKLRDKCPACGVPAKMFEDHTDKLSPFRRMALALDVHPVLVHFPQAFSFTILLLGLALRIAGPEWHARLAGTVTVLGVLLPLTVVMAFLAGLFDGKIRFRRVTTPLLIRKMLVGTVFFFSSSGIALLILRDPQLATAYYYGLLGLSVVNVICASVLGFLGVSLLSSRFPG